MEVKQVKSNLGASVLWHNTEYIFSKCTIQKIENGFFYGAVLIDKNKNSTIEVPLTQIELKG